MMNEKLLKSTVEYLKTKKNKDQQDLVNEQKAWSELVRLGVKKEEDIPKYLDEVKVDEVKVEEVKVDEPKPAGKKKNTTPKAATPE